MATRKAINYAKLAQMWQAGKSYEDMGKALNMKGKEKADCWKPVRACISNMLNGKASAWKDKSGKVLKLAPREGMRAIGVGKKMHTKKANAAPKPKAGRKVVKTLAAAGGK